MKNQTVKRKPMFVVHSSSDHRYSHLFLTIYEPAHSSTDHQELIGFKWQSNRDSRGDWYGLSVEVNAHGYDLAARVARAAKLLGKVMPDNGQDTPDALLERFAELGIERGAYDSRESRFVRECDAKPAAFQRYIDDYKAYGRENASIGAMARDEDDAKREITREFAEAIATGARYAEESFSQWIAAGKPVMVAYASKAPEFPALDTLLNKPATTEEIAA